MTMAPVVTSTGVIAPTFEDIFVYLQELFASIYGSDLYLNPDSQDGQFIAALATLIHDLNNAVIAAINSFSPATAQGAGLSSVVKINGIRRLSASNSTAVVSIGGTVGTNIVNGVVTDQFGTRWDLPALVVIPNAGTIDVTATCEQLGAFSAPISALNTIATPTRGWQTVNNAVAGIPGNPVESDATLRQRQASSTAIPALTVLAAMLGALENLVGVARVFIYENDTETTDANGLPAHSICVVIQGGTLLTTAQVIGQYKTPGTTSFGTTSQIITNSIGAAQQINFTLLTLTQVFVLINLKSLGSYIVTTGVAIQTAMQGWLNSLIIGEDSYLGRLFSPANLSGDASVTATGIPQLSLDALSNTYNVTSIYQARADQIVTGGPYTAGETVINITNTGSLAIGQSIALLLDNGSYLNTTIANKVGTAITMNAAIPGGRSAPNGNLMYVAGDVILGFAEAAYVPVIANITIVAT